VSDVGAAVLLVSHGSVDDLDDLPAFLANIRRGHAAPPELVKEVRRRYETIGGSPLNAINRELAAKLETRLRVPVRACNRLWKPSPKEAIDALVRGGSADRIVVVPLAQYSAHVYRDAVERAVAGASSVKLVHVGSWGTHPGLITAFSKRIRAVWMPGTTLMMTAHSLPKSVIDAGDPYEREVRASAEAIAKELGCTEYVLEFQSQGFGVGEWLGRGLHASLESFPRGSRVVIAPIGFLADHVEILYDIDIEAHAWADELGLTLARMPSPNADDDFVEVLASIASPLLGANTEAS
jgi:ferrochelatase